jgi:hypothetical protein
MTAASLREESLHYNGAKQKIVSRKNIHTVKKVLVKRKFEDYKSCLSRYPKSAKHSQPEMLAFLGPARAPHGLCPREVHVESR